MISNLPFFRYDAPRIHELPPDGYGKLSMCNQYSGVMYAVDRSLLDSCDVSS